MNKKVVITGSSKGIGLALARKHLQLGDTVLISSRNEKNINFAVEQLRKEGLNALYTSVMDVTNEDDIKQTINLADTQMGGIDIWINNAGYAGEEHIPLHESTTKDISTVISTNMIGTLLCCKLVAKYMVDKGDGHIFNMDGFGSNGQKREGFLIYGASKRAIPYISNSLAEELKPYNVGVHTLSPGMVLTDLLLSTSDASARKIFNILAERAEDVANFLVPQIRTTTGTGKYYKMLTKRKATLRFMTAWRYKNRFFDEDGNPVSQS